MTHFSLLGLPLRWKRSRMPRRPSFFLLAVVVSWASGCAMLDRDPVVRTIERDPRMPASEIRRFFLDDEPMPFMRIPYDGYAILRGSIKRDGSIVVKAVRSYPDETRNELARSLCEGVRLRPYSTDPRRRPVVHVYVVFYETFSHPRKALVYATLKRTAETAFDSDGPAGGYFHIGDY